MTYPLRPPLMQRDVDRSTDADPGRPEERWFDVDGLRVHGWVAEPDGMPRDGEVVVLPGLGLPDYTFPTALALATLGWRCTVLDLPGFGVAGADATRPDVHAVGRAAARWVRSRPDGTGPVVLFGHSTASQAALTAALDLQDHPRPDTRLSLVMAGPTFTPRQRRLLPLAAATLTAYRRDSLRELVILPSLARGGTDVARVLSSGMRDRPDERLRGLRVPLTLTAGEADSYAPRWWLDRLARMAGSAPSVSVDVLAGSHNNPFTHPDELARVVGAAAAPV